MRVAGVLVGLCLLATTAPAEVPDAEILLESSVVTLPDQVAAAQPVRFLLTRQREVFVGGSQELLSARLEKDDLRPVDERLKAVRKLKGLGESVRLGPGSGERRLYLRRARPERLVVTGDPEQAGAALRPLAELIQALEGFYHPALRRYLPASYAVVAREAPLVGGCRPWTLSLPLADVLLGGRSVMPQELTGWPTGANPAAVCADGRRFVVAFRPLVPGERP